MTLHQQKITPGSIRFIRVEPNPQYLRSVPIYFERHKKSLKQWTLNTKLKLYNELRLTIPNPTGFIPYKSTTESTQKP